MKRIVFVVFALLLSVFIFSFQADAARKEPRKKKIILNTQDSLIKKINVEGVKLRDRQKLQKAIKPYLKKRLTQEDIERLLKEVDVLYLEAGYSGLVKLSYTVKRHTLTIDVALVAR